MEITAKDSQLATEGLVGQDQTILATDGRVTGWIALQRDDSHSFDEGANTKTGVNASPADAVVEGEVAEKRSLNGMTKKRGLNGRVNGHI